MGNMRGTRVPEIRIPVTVNKATQLQCGPRSAQSARLSSDAEDIIGAHESGKTLAGGVKCEVSFVEFFVSIGDVVSVG
jgi:hypothetical protein